MSQIRAALASAWARGDPGIRPSRWVLAIAAALLVGLMVLKVPVSPVVLFGLSAWALIWLVKLVFPAGTRRTPARIAAVAFVTHAMAAIVLFAYAYSRGRAGFYFGDDESYAITARLVSEYVRGTGNPAFGPPSWGGYAYLLSTYGILESAVFTIFGSDLLSIEFLNCAFMSGMIVLLYDLVTRIFGKRPALATALLTAFYPSVLFWSVLNLKDALSLFLAATTFSIIDRLQLRPRLVLFAAALVSLLPMDNLRRWVYYLLSISLVSAIAVAPRLRPLRRMSWTVLLAAATFALIQVQGSQSFTNQFGPQFLVSLGGIRQAMAGEARSAYGGATPPPLQVEQGVTLIIATQAQTTPCNPRTGDAAPTTVIVRPGTRLVLAPTGGPDPQPTAQPGSAFVNPCDRVIVLAPGATEHPGASALTVVVPTNDETVTVSTRSAISGDVLAHAPEGLAYALFAPFPWVIESPVYVAIALEMLLWYVILVAAARSLWVQRALWQRYAPMLLFVLGAIAVFTLVEGNLGTLYRHRAMIIPFATAIASPTLVSIVRWIVARLPLRARRIAVAAVRQLSD